MNLTFIELPPFERFRAEHLSDDEYRAFQEALLKNPEQGDLMQGLGGLRKVRVSDSKRHKGKQGGIRVIYYYFVRRDRIYLVAAYGKDKQTDLTNEQRKNLTAVIEYIKTL